MAITWPPVFRHRYLFLATPQRGSLWLVQVMHGSNEPESLNDIFDSSGEPKQ